MKYSVKIVGDGNPVGIEAPDASQAISAFLATHPAREGAWLVVDDGGTDITQYRIQNGVAMGITASSNDQPFMPSTSPAPSSTALFSRKSGWAAFFYSLSAFNFVLGCLVAYTTQSIVPWISGACAAIVCLFFAFISQILVDIRWLLSRNPHDDTH